MHTHVCIHTHTCVHTHVHMHNLQRRDYGHLRSISSGSTAFLGGSNDGEGESLPATVTCDANELADNFRGGEGTACACLQSGRALICREGERERGEERARAREV